MKHNKFCKECQEIEFKNINKWFNHHRMIYFCIHEMKRKKYNREFFMVYLN